MSHQFTPAMLQLSFYLSTNTSFAGSASHLLQADLWWLRVLVLVLDLRSSWSCLYLEVRWSIFCARCGSWTKPSCRSFFSLDTSACKARIASLNTHRYSYSNVHWKKKMLQYLSMLVKQLLNVFITATINYQHYHTNLLQEQECSGLPLSSASMVALGMGSNMWWWSWASGLCSDLVWSVMKKKS